MSGMDPAEIEQLHLREARIKYTRKSTRYIGTAFFNDSSDDDQMDTVNQSGDIQVIFEDWNSCLMIVPVTADNTSLLPGAGNTGEENVHDLESSGSNAIPPDASEGVITMPSSAIASAQEIEDSIHLESLGPVVDTDITTDIVTTTSVSKRKNVPKRKCDSGQESTTKDAHMVISSEGVQGERVKAKRRNLGKIEEKSQEVARSEMGEKHAEVSNTTPALRRSARGRPKQEEGSSVTSL
ncbi:hypothetical protein M422DRAFT_245954 [Sphaerobolus stellatus SS14]|nr:hypothetical protein M422DRAFT_245954 [Sphaerobolus stellatus SS14]